MVQGQATRWVFASLTVFVLGSTASCATTFVGESHFPGGAFGCFKQCQRIGMDMATFVYVGEYSTACACRPKLAAGSREASAGSADIGGAVAAAGAGVELQRRRAAQQGAMGSIGPR